MDGNYLIPTNSKRSMLLLSLFAPIDLIIFGVGVGITFIMWMAIGSNVKDLTQLIFMCLPAIVTGIMVVPVPNHRNIWQLMVHVYVYITNRRKYCWRGWCFTNGRQKEGNK